MPRVTDIYAALPSITGKFELEYEGELRGADQVARDLIRSAVGTVFTGIFDGVDTRTVVEWFDLGGSLPLERHARRPTRSSRRRSGVQGLRELADARRRSPPGAPAPAGRVGHRLRARRAVRAEEDQPQRRARLRGRRSRAARAAPRREEPTLDEEIRMPAGKKKYYN